jgi:tripartite-type tricarboxylate transporter receptor subunit TctC
MYRVALTTLLAVVSALATPPVASQTSVEAYPTRPIKLVAPFPPGGTVDLLARFISKEMRDAWNQPVVVENRSGAGGMIGADFVAKSPADGYTFGFITFAHFVQPAMMTNLPFDPVADFTPITLLANLPTVICTPIDSGLTTFAQVIKESREGKHFAYGTAGLGSAAHLGGEQINRISGSKLTHVPYRGAGPLTVDLLGGQIPIGMLTISAAIPLIQQGKLRPLAVASDKRARALPNVPTVAETVKGVHFSETYAIVGPKGIPRAVVLKIQQELSRIMALPEAKNRYEETLGIELVASTPDEMGLVLSDSVKKWSGFARELGLKQEPAN